MVLINDKKYACATCIKGHRVSTCTHTDRPLFEVKKKGRPATQCVHCREKRKNGTSNGTVVHTKCACGEVKPPAVIMPGSATAASASVSANPSPSLPSAGSSTVVQASTPGAASSIDVETRKGKPGANATYPNGLKDVHEMAAAAEALSGMGGDEDAIKMAERKVVNLLNPCHCTTGGKCKCCVPKSERSSSVRGLSPTSSGAATPTHSHGVTDGLIEMFQSKATTSTTPTESSCCSSSTRPNTAASTSATPTWAQLMTPRETHLSPTNMHHPAHTSPHVHKTKLYSPYSTSGHSTPRHGIRREASSAGHRVGSMTGHTSPPPPKLRPISDMNILLGAVFREDGTIAETIPRSALGLPGISTFDQVAEEGGVKFEPMELDAPIQFPTSEDVVIGACGCGENCDCPDCATHGNPSRNGEHAGHAPGCCGDSCKSSFDCSDHLSLPRGIQSIGHLLSLAAANVPHPAQRRPIDLNAHATDTRVLPPAARHNEEAARSLGLVKLKPLECCNGRCQCPPGKCTCVKECCGCCVRCACDEDGDSKMNGHIPKEQPAKSGCCSTSTEPQRAGSVSSFSASATPRQSSPAKSTTATPPPIPSPMSVGAPPIGTPPISGAAEAVRAEHQRNSPQPTVGNDPINIRRASSTSQNKAPSGAASRRGTVNAQGIQRSASTGKQASKALALHTTANHPHAHPSHRPILPKPPSASQLGGTKTAHPSRVASPAIHGPAQSAASSSVQNSRHGSPAVGPVSQEPPVQTFQLPDPAVQTRPPKPQRQPSGNVPVIPTMPHMPQASGFITNSYFPPNPATTDVQPSVAQADPSNDDYEMDDELLAFINQFTASQNDANATYNPAPSSESSLDQPLVTPDLESNPQMSQLPAMSATSGQEGQGVEPNIEEQFMAMLNNALQEGSTNGSMGMPLNQNQYFPPVQPGQPMSVNNTSTTPLPMQQQRPAPMSQRAQPHQPHQQQPRPPPQNFGGSESWAPTMQQFAAGPSGSSQQGDAQSSGRQLGYQSPMHGDGSANSLPNTGFAFSLADYIAGQAAANAPVASQAQPDPIYRQLPPQSTAFLQQMLGNNPTFAPSANAQPTAMGHLNGQASNMIDLSKPLNANDVERILRALQDQQAQNNPGPSQAVNGGHDHHASHDCAVEMCPQNPLGGGFVTPAAFVSTQRHRQQPYGNYSGNLPSQPSPKSDPQQGSMLLQQQQQQQQQQQPQQQQSGKPYQPNGQASFDPTALFNPFSTSDDLFDRYMTSNPTESQEGMDGMNGFMDVNRMNQNPGSGNGLSGSNDLTAWLGGAASGGGSQMNGEGQGQNAAPQTQMMYGLMTQSTGV